MSWEQNGTRECPKPEPQKLGYPKFPFLIPCFGGAEQILFGAAFVPGAGLLLRWVRALLFQAHEVV